MPEVSISKLKAVSLCAYVSGTALTPESYTEAGPQIFWRAMWSGSILLSTKLSRPVATMVGFQAK
jgi:hypothetical protein